MYSSGTGTQVCANVPPPVYYGSPYPGAYPSVYANNPPYFGQANAYQYPYQNATNHGPVDNRFSHRTNNQTTPNASQPPVCLSVPPMNMPIPYPPYGGQFPYPAPIPPYANYHAPPQYGDAMNNFQRNPPPPPYPPPPNGTKIKSERFHPYQQNNRKFNRQPNKQFHCGSCDKEFYTADKYEKHIAEHVSCGLEGCTFKAHPMIVEKHIAMQHRNGLFKRIVKGNSPEEIAKWVDDRKKRYPTKYKITEKQIQKDEMEKRGERYDDQRKSHNHRSINPKESRGRQQASFGNKGSKRTFGNSTRKFHFKTDYQHRGPKDDASKGLPAKKEARKMPVDDFEYQRNLPPFRGTEYYLMSEMNNDEQDYSGSDSEQSNLTTPVDVECSALNTKSCPALMVEGERSSSNTKPCPALLVEVERSASNTKPCPAINSLALIMGYESSDNSDDGDEQKTACPSTLNETDDSGPEECSSKLPVPEFILKDLVESVTPVKEEDAKKSSSEPCVKEAVCGEAENNENSSTGSKKLTKKRRKNRNGKSDEDEQGASKNEKTNSEDAAKNKETNSQDEGAKPKAVMPVPRKRYKPPTLLEKLLAPEIKHERNVILQCVRYVVNNNYFGIGSNSNNESTITL